MKPEEYRPGCKSVLAGAFEAAKWAGKKRKLRGFLEAQDKRMERIEAERVRRRGKADAERGADAQAGGEAQGASVPWSDPAREADDAVSPPPGGEGRGEAGGYPAPGSDRGSRRA